MPLSREGPGEDRPLWNELMWLKKRGAANAVENALGLMRDMSERRHYHNIL